jgi:hypothetical protein
MAIASVDPAHAVDRDVLDEEVILDQRLFWRLGIGGWGVVRDGEVGLGIVPDACGLDHEILSSDSVIRTNAYIYSTG